MKAVNILIVGVGGQGTLLASRILGAVANNLGLDCKLSEVHGMSQRGGSVVTHVRIGEKVLSPVINFKEADYILAFEKLEALRWCDYLKNDGTILINNQQILPMPVIIGQAKYPDDILEKLNLVNKKYKLINGLALAEIAGTTKAVNVVMIGALLKLLNLPYEDIEKAVCDSVPERFLEMNIKALSLGYNED